MCLCGEGERGLGRAVFKAYQNSLCSRPVAPKSQAESKLARGAARPDDFQSDSYHFIQRVGCLAFVNLDLQVRK